MTITRKKVCAAILLAACAYTLTGCGDDSSATVSAWSLSDLEQTAVTGVPDGAGTPPGVSGEDGVSEADRELAGGGAEGQTAAQDGSLGYGDRGTVRITVSAAGDVTLGTYKGQDYSYSFAQAYDQAQDNGYLFENVRELFAADDMTLVNLEGPLTTSENMREGLPFNIKGAPEYAGLLTSGSIEAVSMGNNHRLDYGEEGTADTVAALEKEGIVYAYDEYTGIYETKGIKIGFVSGNELTGAAAVEKVLENGIARLKEEGADLILACCHWGNELENEPDDYQRTLGRKCVDWGADLVIGHHPHVLQGVDWYQGKFIIYSLGNFSFGANRNPADKDTMIFQQTFTFDDGVKREDAEARVIPCSISSLSSRNDFRPTPSQGEDARRIMERLNEYSRDFGVTFDGEGNVIPPE